MAFFSYASNLVRGDTNGETDVFVRDVRRGITTRVSVGTTETQGTFPAVLTAMSQDGRYIQGSRMNLSGDDLEHVVVVPGGFLASAA